MNIYLSIYNILYTSFIGFGKEIFGWGKVKLMGYKFGY